MSIRRVGALLGKEFIYGPKSFMFFWAFGFPLLLSALVSLIFGSLFSDRAKLGIADLDRSPIVAMAEELPSLNVSEYAAVERLRRDMERGAVDVGVVVPEGFTESAEQGEAARITSYVWGESLAKDRAVINAALVGLFRDLSGRQAPVAIESVSLGEETTLPWSDRLLPFIVLIGVFFGGIVLPASSLIEEKDKRTLAATVLTPATVGDVFLSKGIVGIVLSLIMGILVLLINQAFGLHPGLLVLVMALGGIMAVSLGLILGAFVRDISTLFSIWKLGGILLFGPAIVYMFPAIPQWVGKIFPTYYLTQPVVSISQQGAGWADVSTNVFILIAIDVVMLALTAVLVSRARERQLAL